MNHDPRRAGPAATIEKYAVTRLLPQFYAVLRSESDARREELDAAKRDALAWKEGFDAAVKRADEGWKLANELHARLAEAQTLIAQLGGAKSGAITPPSVGQPVPRSVPPIPLRALRGGNGVPR